MVVFTCSYCGESVQKPKVEKHYLTKCRNRNPNLSCMDCFKDFHGKEYEVHTKCISEEQRYSGKGFVAKTPKGEQKQNAWVEIITEVLHEQKNAPQSVIKLIQEVSKHTNTPRKKPKFINFVKNVCGGRTNAKDIDAAWDIISVKLSALRQTSNNQKENQGIDNKPSNSTEKQNEKEKQPESRGGSGQSTSDNDTEVTKKGKKKDRISEKSGKEVDIEQKGEDCNESNKSTGNKVERNENVEEGNSKVKKKAKKGDKSGEKSDTSGRVNENGLHDDSSKSNNGVEKKSKKKDKKLNLLQSSLTSTVHLLSELESELQNGIVHSLSTVKEEKKQKKRQNNKSASDADDKPNKLETNNELQNSILDSVSTVQEENKQKKRHNSKSTPDANDKPNKLVTNNITCDAEIIGFHENKHSEEFVEVKKRKKTKSSINETSYESDKKNLELNNMKDEQSKLSPEKNYSKKDDKDANVNGLEDIEKNKELVKTKSKKQLKEEKKKKKYEEELKKASQPLPETESETPEETLKKSKKRKNLESVDSNVETNQNDKPKKSKANEDISNLHDENVASEINSKKEKFSWDEFIITTLKKRGNEMAYNRLHKKVLAAYTEITGKEPNEKMVERLGKKIVGAPRVKVIKEKAVLLA